MKKIPSLFVRDFAGNPKFVLPQVTPGCEWVFLGEGTPTRKRDGTACMVDDGGKHFRRYDAKRGKTPPEGFVPAQPDPDPETGHWPGWLPIGDGPQDKWYRAAEWPTEPGTYELCGPKFQTNAEGLEVETFFRHGAEVLPPVFSANNTQGASAADLHGATRSVLEQLAMEGIVWHHPDGRMVKIKRCDFGLPWPLMSRQERGYE